MNTDFKIVINNVSYYKDSVAFIIINEQNAALITHDEGGNKLKIEFLKYIVYKRIDYEMVIDMLREAAIKLIGYYPENKDLKKKYLLSEGSPIDYEELVISIIIDNKEIIQIDQEKGENNLQIEFSEYAPLKKFDYTTIMDALQEAKKVLLR